MFATQIPVRLLSRFKNNADMSSQVLNVFQSQFNLSDLRLILMEEKICLKV